MKNIANPIIRNQANGSFSENMREEYKEAIRLIDNKKDNLIIYKSNSQKSNTK